MKKEDSLPADVPAPPAGEDLPSLIVTILCGDPADGRDFIRSVLDTEPAAPEEGELLFQNQIVKLDCLSTDPEKHSGWKDRVNRANILILLIHHMDPDALRIAQSRFRKLGGNWSVPLGVFVLRHPDDVDYKIGCPSCGQKLKMKESDIGKRGRCPSCRTAIQIPSPADYLRGRLLLPDSIPILNVVTGQAALCRGALVNMLARTAIRIAAPDRKKQENYLKQATVPIYVEGDGIRIGS